MKVLLLLALAVAVMGQTFPDISGTWVSDSCESVGQGISFYYFRTYQIRADGYWTVTAKLYGGADCTEDKLNAEFVSEGAYLFTAESNATACYGSSAKVYDIQFWSNITKTLTPRSSSFASTASQFCSTKFTVNETSDISDLNCSLFQIYSPCPEGEFDIITVLSNPTRFYNGKRSASNQCQEVNRPKTLSPNAAVKDGSGISASPNVCSLTAPPTSGSAPQASTTPTTPTTAATPKASNAVITSASMLLFAAFLFF